MSTDYESDMAIFNSMPDTATKDEIRKAIEQARHNRSEQARLTGIMSTWTTNFKYPSMWPEEWDAKDTKVVMASLHWLIFTAFPAKGEL